MGIFDKVFGKKIKVPQVNEQSTAVSIRTTTDEKPDQGLTEQFAKLEKMIAEMQESKRSLRHELATVNFVIASLQPKAQELGDAPSPVREALKHYVTTKESLSDSLDAVNDTLRNLSEVEAMVVDAIKHLPGGWKWEKKPFNYSETYLFCWNEIPGNDNGASCAHPDAWVCTGMEMDIIRLKEFLSQKYGIDWVKTAKIEKIDDGKTIQLSNEQNSISLKLNTEKTEVNLKIDNGRNDKFIAEIRNGKLNISYENYEKYTSRKDEKGNDRVNAIVALGKIGEPAVEPLIRALKDENDDVRAHAAYALGKIGKPAIEPLIRALKDENEDVRRMAVVALGEMGDARAREYLSQAMTDESETVREIAKAALERIKG
jgi:chaperonin cofactor prefoldin